MLSYSMVFIKKTKSMRPPPLMFSWENSRSSFFFLNSRSSRPNIKKACNFIKKRLQHRCFPVNIAKLFRTPILKNICGRLLLKEVAILKNTSEQLLLTLLLNSKNLLTSYEQVTISSMLHNTFNQN